MKKSDIKQKPSYYDRYINLVEDIELNQALQNGLTEMASLDISQLRKIGKNTYAPDKWSINEIFQHLIDSERIFCYRILLFARQDQTIPPGFDQDLFTANSKANHRSIVDIIDEYKAVRQATIALYQSFDRDELLKTGISWQDEMSVLAMGFTIVGHQIHHFNFIKSHYYPLAD